MFTKVEKYEPNSIDSYALCHFHQQHHFKNPNPPPYKIISKQEQEGGNNIENQTQKP